MTLPESLVAAIGVFRELGWAEADDGDIMDLPLGTTEQRRIAKAGLSKGAWGGIEQLSENSWGWRNRVGVDADMLGAFAVRVGVSARRAAEIFPRRLPAEQQGALLAERGAVFVSTFAGVGRRALWVSTGIVHALALTDTEIPPNPGYLERWAEIASTSLGADPGAARDPDLVPVAVIGARYRESLTAALQAGIAAPQDSAALLGGVERGWIGGDEARELVLFAMDRAQRPKDRVAWSRVLTDTLAAPREWLLERAGVLVSSMSFGDDAIVTSFAPVLLTSGDDEMVAQALFAGLAARSAKAKTAVLQAALDAPAPGPETAAMLADQLSPLAAAKDRRVARNAASLLAAWGVEAPHEPAERPRVPLGLWRPTPLVADVARFDAGIVSPEALTILAARLVESRTNDATLDLERFLATANALARRDPAAARTALRGVRQSWGRGLVGVRAWVRGEEVQGLDQRIGDGRWSHQPVYTARDAGVFQALGSVPVLLSTPSWDDFRIDPAEIADRLDAYDGADVIEADLQVALGRIDVSLVTPEVSRRLSAARSRVRLQSGTYAARAVGEILGSWIREPAVHPDRREDPWARVASVPALDGLPPRLTASYGTIEMTLFPTWPEAPFAPDNAGVAAVRIRPNGVVPSTALLDNVSEQSTPLDAAIAAWHRGVLRPGVAAAADLGWQGQISSIAARAEAWAELAEAGLLSVIWPLAVDVVAAASAGARVAPGVAELVEMLDRYLPEVELAVAAGLAPGGAIGLEPVRRLAARGGSSRAVAAARALTTRLPEAAPVADPDPVRPTDAEFAAVWPELPDPDPVDDGATFVIEIADTRRGPLPTLVVRLPDGETVRAERMSWLYSLVHERQAPVTDAEGAERWLSSVSGRLTLAEGRRTDGRSAPAESGEIERRDASRFLVAHALVSQLVRQPESYYFAEAVSHGVFGQRAIDDAVRVLLPLDGFDPYKVVRVLKHGPQTLPALWPVLVRAIEYASTLARSPAWLVRVLDVASEHAILLREAASRGLIPGEWPGLAGLVTAATSPTARRKSGQLAAALALA
ncbi:MAG TPA: hypothetical protein VKZ73_10125 [Microbacterium sp.]|nr:hypothetical protein [Microbacterium sp.]